MAALRNLDPEPRPTPHAERSRRRAPQPHLCPDPADARIRDEAWCESGVDALYVKEAGLFPPPLDQRVGWTRDAA